MTAEVLDSTIDSQREVNVKKCLKLGIQIKTRKREVFLRRNRK